MSKPVLKVLDNEFTIYRFEPSQTIPSPLLDSSFYWVGKTDDELSVVCDSSIELLGGEKLTGWACLKVLGPMDISVTGVIAGISAVLASAKIGISVISTFDTDYILVPSTELERAKRALSKRGYGVQDSQSGKPANRTPDAEGQLRQ